MPVFLASGDRDQFLPPPLEDSGEDGVDYVDTDEERPAAPLTPAQRADQVLADPEVQEAFAKLEDVMGKPFDIKTRQKYVLNKEGDGDTRVAVLDGLTKSVLEILAKKQQEAAPAEVIAQVDPLPAAVPQE